MSDQRIIKKFAAIKKLGIFDQHPPLGGGNPEIKAATLIYGFNGTGKTTLSRIFASLEAGLVRPELSEAGDFQIELSDGTVINRLNNLNALKGRVLTFNADFIESNFRWKEGKARPIFYIGEQQTRLSQRLESIEKAIADLSPKAEQASRDAAKAEKDFTSYKRNAARNIGEQLNQARAYDAAKLANDYSNFRHDTEWKIEESERQQLRQLINSDAPLPKIDNINLDQRIYPFAVDANSLLKTTLGEIAMRTLQDHPTMLSWIKEGTRYHEDKHLKSCLLCGNDITSRRLEEITSALNADFDKLVQRIAHQRQEAESLQAVLSELKASTPSKGDIAKDCLPAFERAQKRLLACASSGQTHLKTLIDCLSVKAASPNTDYSELALDLAEMKQWDEELESALVEINAAIQRHNLTNEQFTQSQANAKIRIKNHFLAEGWDQYREQHALCDSAKSLLETITAKRDDLLANATEIRQGLREHGPAAARMNQLISTYLGHGTIKIEAINKGEDGYSLSRNGKPITGPLSEGEKTAISVCYFLSTLEAERRELKKLIVVVDDPISSLDTRALNYAFNLIRGAISEAAQIIILTHNIHFMNEAKKWLKTRHSKGNAALLFLDSRINPQTGQRTSTLVELPKLIREYESEYHYLFKMTLGFRDNANEYEGYFYLMPNALRKVMDIFFAFKVPGSSGLAGKLQNETIRDCGLAKEKIHALDRLAQLESHADSLDDLVSMSSMTIEETKDATAALLTLIERVDPGHYKQMCNLCA